MNTKRNALFLKLFLFSSPEPKAHWWAYRIDRPPSSVVRPSVCLSSTFFKNLRLRNHWADWSQISYSLHGVGKRKFVQMIIVTWPRWPPGPYMVKTLKKSTSLKVIVGHIFETSIKCLCFIRSQWNFVCMFFKTFWTQLNKFRGKICILKTDFFSSNLC